MDLIYLTILDHVKSAADFLHTESLVENSLETILNFLIYPSEDKHLGTTTIMTYKVVLSEPLLCGFGNDSNTETFSSLLWLFTMQRWGPAWAPITWSLTKGLWLLPFPKFSWPSAPITHWLKKAAFITALARVQISELSCLRKGYYFITFTSSCQLLLSPSPLFLAKNENSLKRKSPLL